ncbi:hypothetical protein FB45DRAFT_1032274 [Roridomyces roridus]|uniref:Uncharacterized protein n=1 Tax=Roridomyces roridus TaxID=1738132 RepID=A0AAD7FHM7_9AGAR|nr:hypothetical protein FB45DRAFT_1032274 [Roridomyces roridus]
MKFFSSLVATSLLVATAFGQGVRIGAPAAGTTVSSGTNITVEVERPRSLSSSVEVGLVIGFLSCETDQDFCTQDPEAPAIPQSHKDVDPGNPNPYQNFSVQIPVGTPTGPGQLSVVHYALIGAGPFPFLQTQNITINVA